LKFSPGPVIVESLGFPKNSAIRYMLQSVNHTLITTGSPFKIFTRDTFGIQEGRPERVTPTRCPRELATPLIGDPDTFLIIRVWDTFRVIARPLRPSWRRKRSAKRAKARKLRTQVRPDLPRSRIGIRLRYPIILLVLVKARCQEFSLPKRKERFLKNLFEAFK